MLGESGSGKSTALRNFEPGEIGIFNVASKPLPFRKKLPKVDGATYQKIEASLSKPKLKSYAIDDSQYLMCFASFDKAKETGYGKFTDLAVDFKGLIDASIKTPPDTIIYYLHHIDKSEDGHIKAKTIGKMLDSQLTVEGLFPIVLLCKVDGNRHYFVTQSDGYTTCKSPMDMLPLEMDNDLKAVDTAIREYWELSPAKNESEEK